MPVERSECEGLFVGGQSFKNEEYFGGRGPEGILIKTQIGLKIKSI